jgi:hypothetical protein
VSLHVRVRQRLGAEGASELSVPPLSAILGALVAQDLAELPQYPSRRQGPIRRSYGRQRLVSHQRAPVSER